MIRRWNPRRFLRLLRGKGMSRVALAKAMGLSRSALYDYFPTRFGKSDVQVPSLERVYAMCIAANIDPSLVDSRLRAEHLATTQAG